jgi:ligand-binding SRPBCC domain-containing protein
MIYQLKTLQKIPSDIDTIWDFISSPRNLKIITPEFMGFDIIGEVDAEKMYQGMIISYKVSPLLGLKMNWTTEITHVVEKQYFVDEQRFGPYQFWHHKHFLQPIKNGVEMRDVIDYKIGYGIFGNIANHLIVKKQLKTIFDYRYKKIEEIFGNYVD